MANTGKEVSQLMEYIYKEKYNERHVIAKGIAVNTKKISEGDIFICLPGYNTPGGEVRTDTHLFVEDAIKKGAVAIVAARRVDLPDNIPLYIVDDCWSSISKLSAKFYDYPSRNMKVIGVTGTNGKTSITYMIESILRNNSENPCVLGTISNRIGDYKENTDNTTPEASIIHKFIHKAKDLHSNYCVIEVTSHALELKRVNDIDFDIAVFTNLTQDHLNFHGDMESYYKAKEKLFHLLKTDGVALINKDSNYFQRLEEVCKGKCVSFGIDNDADFKAENINFTSNVSEFDVIYNEKVYKASIPLIGKHYVSNSLAAIAAAHFSGISIEEAIRGISDVYIPGRSEKIECGQPFDVFIDYAHTPDGVKNTLEQLRLTNPNRLISIFGCGGDRDKTKRPLMGEIAEKYSDFVVVTSDNPRSEDEYSILIDIEKGMKANNHELVCDRKEAIRRSLVMATKGDMIILLGRGHEEYQKVKGEKVFFNDRLVVEDLLKQLGYQKKNNIL